MNHLEAITMREAIKALVLMDWSEYCVYFRPRDRGFNLNPEGRWMMYDIDGSYYIARLHLSNVPFGGEISGTPFFHCYYKIKEVIYVDTGVSCIPESVLDDSFWVEFAPRFESWIHLEDCGVFLQQECTCLHDFGVCGKEKEIFINSHPVRTHKEFLGCDEIIAMTPELLEQGPHYVLYSSKGSGYPNHLLMGETLKVTDGMVLTTLFGRMARY